MKRLNQNEQSKLDKILAKIDFGTEEINLEDVAEVATVARIKISPNKVLKQEALTFDISDESKAEQDFEATATEVMIRTQLKSTHDKLEELREIARGFFYRTEAETEAEIADHVNIIENMKFPNYFSEYVKTKYSYAFWRRDPDIAFKYRLAKELLEAIRKRSPSFSNAVLEGIVEMSPETSYIMSSWIDN